MTYDEIAEKFFPDTKRNIKKALGHSMEIKPSSVQEVLRLYKENVWHKTPNMTDQDFKKLAILGTELEKRSRCRYLAIYDQGKIGAAGMLVLGFNSLIFLFGSTNSLGRKNGSMRFLFDSLIREYAGKNMVFDFEGSSVESVAYFYSSFGSERLNFFKISYSKSPFLEQLIKQKQYIHRQFKHLSIVGKL